MSESARDVPSLLRRSWVVLLVAALAVLAGFWGRRVLAPGPPRAAPTAAGGNEAQMEFALDALDGAKITAQDFSGRVLVVDFWATWCGPCRRQEEILSALHERYKSQPVSFVAINVGEPEELVRDFVAEDPFVYPVLMDPSQALSAKYGIYALPTVMILDRDQRILFRNMGISSGLQVGSAIDRALGTS